MPWKRGYNVTLLTPNWCRHWGTCIHVMADMTKHWLSISSKYTFLETQIKRLSFSLVFRSTMMWNPNIFTAYTMSSIKKINCIYFLNWLKNCLCNTIFLTSHPIYLFEYTFLLLLGHPVYFIERIPKGFIQSIYTNLKILNVVFIFQYKGLYFVVTYIYIYT